MKKILFSLIAVLGLFSACSNDDIEIQSTNATTITVDTKSVYDSYGSTQSIAERFLAEGKDYALGVFTYVYDAEGKLAASKKDYINNFKNLVSNKFNLPYGEYTVITLQTLVTKDTHKMESYEMAGEEKLSTLEIKATSNFIFWYEAVGMASKKVTIDEKSLTHNMVNAAIGSRVDCEFYNFDKSNGTYDMGLFATKERALGRYLSPEYSGNARFEWDDPNQKNYWYIRGFKWTAPCLKEQEGFDVYMLEEGDFTYNLSPSHTVEKDGETDFGNWTSYPSANAKFTCRDGQRLYGGCYYLGANDPECSAGVFATTNEYQNWLAAAKEGYTTPDTPESSASAVPYIKWGANANSIKTHLESNGYTYINGVITDDNKNWLDTYTNAQKDNVYGYYFETDKTNLKQIGVIYENLSFETILSALETAGFTNLGYDEDLGGYLGYSNDSMYLLTEVSGNRFILLMPYSSNAMHRSPAKWFFPNAQQRLEMFNSLKK